MIATASAPSGCRGGCVARGVGVGMVMRVPERPAATRRGNEPDRTGHDHDIDKPQRSLRAAGQRHAFGSVHQSPAERTARGKAARRLAPRSGLAAWEPPGPAVRPDGDGLLDRGNDDILVVLLLNVVDGLEAEDTGLHVGQESYYRPRVWSGPPSRCQRAQVGLSEGCGQDAGRARSRRRMAGARIRCMISSGSTLSSEACMRESATSPPAVAGGSISLEALRSLDLGVVVEPLAHLPDYDGDADESGGDCDGQDLDQVEVEGLPSSQAQHGGRRRRTRSPGHGMAGPAWPRLAPREGVSRSRTSDGSHPYSHWKPSLISWTAVWRSAVAAWMSAAAPERVSAPATSSIAVEMAPTPSSRAWASASARSWALAWRSSTAAWRSSRAVVASSTVDVVSMAAGRGRRSGSPRRVGRLWGAGRCRRSRSRGRGPSQAPRPGLPTRGRRRSCRGCRPRARPVSPASPDQRAAGHAGPSPLASPRSRLPASRGRTARSSGARPTPCRSVHPIGGGDGSSRRDDRGRVGLARSCRHCATTCPASRPPNRTKRGEGRDPMGLRRFIRLRGWCQVRGAPQWRRRPVCPGVAAVAPRAASGVVMVSRAGPSGRWVRCDPPRKDCGHE